VVAEVSSRPSIAQFQVPSEFLVTVPREAVRVTTSEASASAHVPVLVIEVPSLPETAAFDTVIVGGLLEGVVSLLTKIRSEGSRP